MRIPMPSAEHRSPWPGKARGGPGHQRRPEVNFPGLSFPIPFRVISLPCPSVPRPAPAASSWSTRSRSTASTWPSACRAKAIWPCSTRCYDARNQIQLIICRQEGGAANMAEAYGKLTGRPGICFVTRGPGATNASIGVHTAFQDSTPMILFIGQVARDQAEREAFQEIDYRRMFGADGQMGGADRRRRAHSGVGEPGLPPRRRRPARPGGARAARGHADRPRRRAPTPAPYKTRAGRTPARPSWQACAICWPRPSGRS